MGLNHTHQHPPQSELPAQRSSRLDNKESTHRANTPPQPQLATCYVEAGAKLRESRGGEALGENVRKLEGGRDMEDPNIYLGMALVASNVFLIVDTLAYKPLEILATENVKKLQVSYLVPGLKTLR